MQDSPESATLAVTIIPSVRRVESPPRAAYPTHMRLRKADGASFGRFAVHLCSRVTRFGTNICGNIPGTICDACAGRTDRAVSCAAGSEPCSRADMNVAQRSD